MDFERRNNSFEKYKRKAASLSNEIDLKLVSFSRLSVGSYRTLNEEEQSLLSDEDEFDRMKEDLEGLLKQLADVVEQMNEFVSQNDDVVMSRTLTRNMEILQSYTREFEKTESNFRARMDRQQLLHSPDEDASDPLSNGRNRRLEFTLRENDYTRNSHRLVDEQIAIALETREHLGGQRIMFKRLQTRLNDMSNRFPVMNSLIQRITAKQKRSAVILGSVVAACTFLLLMYAFW